MFPALACQVNIQYLEIYNENLYDLLDITSQPHEVSALHAGHRAGHWAGCSGGHRGVSRGEHRAGAGLGAGLGTGLGAGEGTGRLQGWAQVRHRGWGADQWVHPCTTMPAGDLVLLSTEPIGLSQC